jgi:hypothetical protein
LLHPSGELRHVDLVVLMDVEGARVLALGRAGGTGREALAVPDPPFERITFGHVRHQRRARV